MAYGFEREREPRGEALATAPRRMSAAMSRVIEPEAQPHTPAFDALHFWPRVDKSGGPRACWPWTGHVTRKGRGRMSVRGYVVEVHRYALETALGPIGAAAACHKCNNPICCNTSPGHLYAGDAMSNASDRKDFVRPIVAVVKEGLALAGLNPDEYAFHVDRHGGTEVRRRGTSGDTW